MIEAVVANIAVKMMVSIWDSQMLIFGQINCFKTSYVVIIIIVKTNTKTTGFLIETAFLLIVILSFIMMGYYLR